MKGSSRLGLSAVRGDLSVTFSGLVDEVEVRRHKLVQIQLRNYL